MFERPGINSERPSRQCLCECSRLVRVWRENPEKLGARSILQQFLKCRLDIDPGSDRKLVSRRRNFAGRHAEMFEHSFA